ncbi:MAG TPA: DedA family protein [Candidatus Kapabacteria bacterium]|nr:DedA family protein [Candidatus Kapabacteria bacterium]
MTESIIQWLQGLPPLGVYAALFFTAYIENLFPPAPSDVVMLFIATLAGMGLIGIVPSIAIATAGSVSGFMTAFWIGRRFGRRLVESNRLPFITEKALAKVDGWFERWGYGVVIANRFLAGTRAVISFFTGMSRLKFLPTTLLCVVSALAWNSLIIWLGSLLGANWRDGIVYVQRYGQVVVAVLVVLALVWGVRKFIRYRREVAARRRSH